MKKRNKQQYSVQNRTISEKWFDLNHGLTSIKPCFPSLCIKKYENDRCCIIYTDKCCYWEFYLLSSDVKNNIIPALNSFKKNSIIQRFKNSLSGKNDNIEFMLFLEENSALQLCDVEVSLFTFNSGGVFYTQKANLKKIATYFESVL